MCAWELLPLRHQVSDFGDLGKLNWTESVLGLGIQSLDATMFAVKKFPRSFYSKCFLDQYVYLLGWLNQNLHFREIPEQLTCLWNTPVILWFMIRYVWSSCFWHMAPKALGISCDESDKDIFYYISEVVFGKYLMMGTDYRGSWPCD